MNNNAPEYILVDDVTHQPTPTRGPQVLKAVKAYEDKGEKKTKIIEFKVPSPPNPKCKKCYGRGYIGFEAGTEDLLICLKCYPEK